MESINHELIKAIQRIPTDWDGAHHIVQDHNTNLACWIHAVLHKIEGDESNSRYWYARCNKNYEDFIDTKQELEAILKQLNILG